MSDLTQSYEKLRALWEQRDLAKAARIEQLNERLTAATDDAKEAEAYAEQLEAKLTKAVEALRWYADHCMPKYAGEVLVELEKKE
jgi:hypothetical protein